MDNKLVKHKQTKYGNGKTNGRPKQKGVVAQAERRKNDILGNKVTLYSISYCILIAIYQLK